MCWQQIHVNSFFFAAYSYAEKLAQMPSRPGFCSVVLTDALCWCWWKSISAWERPCLSVTHYAVSSKPMYYLLPFDVFISILLFYRPTKMSSMSVIEFRFFRSKLLAAFFFWDKESLTSSGWTSLDLGILNSQTLASFSLTSNGVKAIRSHSCFMPFWKLKFSSSAGPGFLSSVQRVFMGENLWTAEEKVQCKAVCLFFPPSCVLPNFPVTCALWFLLRIFRLDLNSTYRKLKNSSDYHG